MKKLILLFLFSYLTVASWAGNGLNTAANISLDSLCSVTVSWDSTNTGGILVTANPTGTAPFSFSWNTGETTQSITLNGWGGVNYCVTVTDAEGCVAEGCVFNTPVCYTLISGSPTIGLTAQPIGTAPFTYVWSNGNTSQSIQPNTPGTYCVTTTDVTGCTATACTWWGPFPDTCSASFNAVLTNAGYVITASGSGAAPFSYVWNTGATSPTITATQNGSYCATITDAVGEICMGCYNLNGCAAQILPLDSAGTQILYALPNFIPVSFLWSTGETDNVIEPTTEGNYCVTITGGGCVTTTCYYYTLPTNFSISGFLTLEDSTLVPPFEGIVELYSYDATNDIWDIIATQPLQNNPANNWSATYNFGTQTAGRYIVKATLDPASPYAADYLPSYYYSSVLWDEADIITLPSYLNSFGIIMQDGQNLTNGSGSISGIVTEGDGFTANNEGDRNGTPRPNTSVVLFDSNEQPIGQRTTNSEGRYAFNNLPFGTYKVAVDVVGKSVAEKWITLSPQDPEVGNVWFEVTEDGVVVLGIKDLVDAANIEIFPNPTTEYLNLAFTSKANFNADFSVLRMDGTVLSTVNQQITKGAQRISINVSELPTGLFILKMNNGNNVYSTKFVKF